MARMKYHALSDHAAKSAWRQGRAGDGRQGRRMRWTRLNLREHGDSLSVLSEKNRASRENIEERKVVLCLLVLIDEKELAAKREALEKKVSLSFFSLTFSKLLPQLPLQAMNRVATCFCLWPALSWRLACWVGPTIGTSNARVRRLVLASAALCRD